MPRHRMTRRDVLTGGLVAAGGLLLPGCARELPPTYGHLLRIGDNFTYAAHRLLLPGQSLAREYTRADVSSFPAIGTTDPGAAHLATFHPEHGPVYARLRHGGFADWRLAIEGHVARPGTYSLEDLKRFPARTQITRHACEEGWSAIAEWQGVPLRSVLEAAGVRPDARFVSLHTYDHWLDSIDMLDALHPQTLLAYGMNGRELPVPHGAPVRLRVATQLGYKSLKFLRKIVVTSTFDPSASPVPAGWSWYAGI